MKRVSVSTLGLLLSVAWFGSSCASGSPAASATVRTAAEKALDTSSIGYTFESGVQGTTDEVIAERFRFTGRGATNAGGDLHRAVYDDSDTWRETRQIDGQTFLRDTRGQWYGLDSREWDHYRKLFVPLFDPYTVLDSIAREAGSAKHEGSEEVHGQRAERYSLGVPDGGTGDEFLDPFLELRSEARAELWIGADGLPARLRIEIPGAASEWGLATAAALVPSLVIDFVSYDEPMRVGVPDAADVIDWGDLKPPGSTKPADPFEGAKR
jgi:hypothetical protein